MLRWRIGDVTVTSVAEMELPIPGPLICAEATPEALAPYGWLRPHFADDDGNIVLRIQALIVESEGRRIAVDTCVGNDKARGMPFWDRMQTPFLSDLEAAGFPRDTIDAVVCTHLHVDHVGWNTMLVDSVAGASVPGATPASGDGYEGKMWVPTFPNARYHFVAEELEHWQGSDDPENQQIQADSVRPILDADLAEVVEPDHRITSEVRLEPTPGHTPAHVSVRISSGGQEAVITGDLMHHPVQCARPEWNATFDSIPDLARSTRQAFVKRYADQPVLVIGTHFASPVAGHIVAHGPAWRFDAQTQ